MAATYTVQVEPCPQAPGFLQASVYRQEEGQKKPVLFRVHAKTDLLSEAEDWAQRFREEYIVGTLKRIYVRRKGNRVEALAVRQDNTERIIHEIDYKDEQAGNALLEHMLWHWGYRHVSKSQEALDNPKTHRICGEYIRVLK